MPPVLHSDEQAFLAAIRDRPTDLLPRMMFADWLDDRGRDAEAVILRTPGTDWWPDLLGRPDLGAALRKRVSPGLPRRCPFTVTAAGGEAILTDSPMLLVNHGAVEAVACVPRFWRQHGPKLVVAHPVRGVRLIGVVPLHTFSRRNWGRERFYVWAFRRAGRDSHPYRLPEWLFDAIPKQTVFRETREVSRDGGHRAYFLTEQDALTALSDGAITWARWASRFTDPPANVPALAA